MTDLNYHHYTNISFVNSLLNYILIHSKFIRPFSLDQSFAKEDDTNGRGNRSSRTYR